MKKLKNLKDLFIHQLKDVYSAEEQIIEAMPKMIDEASSKELKDSLREHLEETKNQKKRLDEIGKKMDLKLTGEKCKAMAGLIKEAQDFVSEDADEYVRDAGIIADGQRIEHYEISAYGTLVQYAKALDMNDVADQLKRTLNEESNADQKLNKIAVGKINEKAKHQEAMAE